MDNNLFNISMASLFITATYEKLLKLEFIDLTDGVEYEDTINNLKRYVDMENEFYHKLTKIDIDTYFNLIKDIHRFNNQVDARIYSRMNDIKRINDGNISIDNNILLSSVISSKLTIDILKNVHNKIKELEDNSEFTVDDVMSLQLYETRFMYHYLTSNYFIERLSLENNFDLNEIPGYSYQDIEKRFNIQFINNIQNNFYNYVIESLNQLTNIKSDDKYLLIYSSIFEIARIEAMLPYLNSDSINKLLATIEEHTIKYDSNSALRKIKKIINKRKEEFNDR